MKTIILIILGIAVLGIGIFFLMGPDTMGPEEDRGFLSKEEEEKEPDGKGRALLPTNYQTAFPNPTDVLIPFFTKLPPDEVLSQTQATVMGMSAKVFERLEHKEYYLKFINFFHNAGLKYIGYISTFNVSALEALKSNPELYEAMCIDSQGEKIIFEWEGVPWQCTNNPIWREFLLELGKTNVNYGVDGIHIDEWLGTYSAVEEADGCFCEYCIKGFREYLKEKYNKEELEILGIDSIDTFDYGLYIKKQKENLLSSDFLDYQMKNIKDFMHELISKTRAYAKKHGKEFPVSANVPELMPKWLPIIDEIDYMLSEYTYEYPPEGRSIPVFKLARSLGKPLVSQLQTSNPALLQRSDLAELVKIYTAEAYAARGFLLIPYDLPAKEPSEEWKYYSVDVKEMSPYYGFIRNNKQYYEDLFSTSKIAVLYSFPSVKQYWTADFYDLSNRLLDSHLQYDVLFAGDDEDMEDRLSLDQLSEYEAIILPNTPNLLDQQVDLLLSYAEAGGNIVVFGQIEPRLKNFVYNKNILSVISDILKNLIHRFGKNFEYSGNIPSAEKISSILKDLIQPNIQTNANENIVMLEYWNNKTHSIVIHLINYNYNIKTKHLSIQKNIDLEVMLNPELLGKNLIISYKFPGGTGNKELDYLVSDKNVKFQIPSLEFYGVVSIKEAGN